MRFLAMTSASRDGAYPERAEARVMSYPIRHIMGVPNEKLPNNLRIARFVPGCLSVRVFCHRGAVDSGGGGGSARPGTVLALHDGRGLGMRHLAGRKWSGGGTERGSPVPVNSV